MLTSQLLNSFSMLVCFFWNIRHIKEASFVLTRVRLEPLIVVRLELTELYPSIEQIMVGEVAGSQFFTQAGAHSFRSALYTSSVPRPRSPLRSLSRTREDHNVKKLPTKNNPGRGQKHLLQFRSSCPNGHSCTPLHMCFWLMHLPLPQWISFAPQKSQCDSSV